MDNTMLLVSDAELFCQLVGRKYGIQMYPSRKLNMYSYLGEFYTMRGTPLRISIVLYPGNTDVKVYSPNKQCVYQKSYITKSDTKALSKSLGLFNFLDRAYKAM